MLANSATTTTTGGNNQGYSVQSRPSSLSILPPPMSQHQQQQQQQQLQTLTHFFPQSTPTYTTALPLLATPSTPIALTPNTVRTIEQSILQTLGEDAEESYMRESQQYTGNFVPPLPSSTSTITLINTWQGGQVSSEGAEQQEEDHHDHQMNGEMDDQKPEMMEEEKPVETKKRKPARKPAQPKVKPEPKQKKAPAPKGKRGTRTPEEDERRKIRRERNKLAAARCRKRRVDHTNKLLEETEGLESKKRALQNQITELQSVREELEFLLENHSCVKNKLRSESVLADLQNLPISTSAHHQSMGKRPRRPDTLNVAVVTSANGSMINVTTPAPPISITTPSNGIAGLGFEPLGFSSDWGVGAATPEGMEKGHAAVSVSSGNSNKGCSLVTPSTPFKKLQDL